MLAYIYIIVLHSCTLTFSNHVLIDTKFIRVVSRDCELQRLQPAERDEVAGRSLVPGGSLCCPTTKAQTTRDLPISCEDCTM